MNAVTDDDVVAEAAHGGHGGALLPLHHCRHAPFGHQPLDPAEGVLPTCPIFRALTWKVQNTAERKLVVGLRGAVSRLNAEARGPIPPSETRLDDSIGLPGVIPIHTSVLQVGTLRARKA